MGCVYATGSGQREARPNKVLQVILQMKRRAEDEN